jgi:hypothetical protein
VNAFTLLDISCTVSRHNLLELLESYPSSRRDWLVFQPLSHLRCGWWHNWGRVELLFRITPLASISPPPIICHSWDLLSYPHPKGIWHGTWTIHCQFPLWNILCGFHPTTLIPSIDRGSIFILQKHSLEVQDTVASSVQYAQKSEWVSQSWWVMSEWVREWVWVMNQSLQMVLFFTSRLQNME